MKIPLLKAGDVFISKDLWFYKIDETWYASSTKTKDARKNTSEFVVIEANTASITCETQEKQNICIPAYRIVAKRLTTEGTWDVNGIEVIFFQSGQCRCLVDKVKITRTMRRLVKFV